MTFHGSRELTTLRARRARALEAHGLLIESVAEWVEGGQLNELVARFGVAGDPTELLRAVLATLTGADMHESWARVERALTNPATKPELLQWAAATPSLAWRKAVASNPALPDEVARALLRAGSVLVRSEVVSRASVPVLLGHDWTKDTSTWVLEKLLGRLPRSEHPRMLAVLAQASSVAGRLVAATHAVDPAVLSMLCRNAEPAVRTAAVGNPVTLEEDRVWAALLS